MHTFLTVKAVRFVLSVSVSIWMAGGCLFGCSVPAMAAETEHQGQTVVAAESCDSARSHHCCESEKPQKPKKIASHAKQLEGVPTLAPAPRGMMKDCPLVVNASAVTSKNSGHLPEPGRGPISFLPLIEKKSEQASTSLVVAFLPNRGPTHLRCCVFLI